MVRVAVFFDTSGSMEIELDGVERIEFARKIWRSVRGRFAGYHSKICTINSTGESITLGENKMRNLSDLERIKIPEPTGATCLWEFLVDEAKQLIKTDDEWVFLLISDGDDNESSGKYYGPGGIEPCAKAIKEMGLDVEFHIIGLGLDNKVAESFRRLSGETGGFFENVTSSSEIDSTITDLDATLAEIGDERIRRKKRRERIVDHNRSSPSQQPALFDEPIILGVDRSLDYGGRVQILTTVSPPNTIDWLEDLLKIRGHMQTIRADSSEFWFEIESELPEHDLIDDVPQREDCWAIDSQKLRQSLKEEMSGREQQGERIWNKLFRTLTFRKPPVIKKEKSVHDVFFELQDDIRKSNPEDRKKIIFRGDDYDQVYYDLLGQEAGEIVVYPTILPPPPPPPLDSSYDEFEEWLALLNPSREEWFQFPDESYDFEQKFAIMKKAVIIDVMPHIDHFVNHIKSVDYKLLFKKFRIAFPKSIDPKRTVIIDSLDPTNNWSKECDDWANGLLLEGDDIELTKAFSIYIQFSLLHILLQYLDSEGSKPMLIVFRFCEKSRQLSLNRHPIFLSILEIISGINKLVTAKNSDLIKDGKWKILQVDEY